MVSPSMFNKLECSNVSTTKYITLWHRRLEHPYIFVLTHLIWILDSNNQSKLITCVGCSMGKSHKLLLLIQIFYTLHLQNLIKLIFVVQHLVLYLDNNFTSVLLTLIHVTLGCISSLTNKMLCMCYVFFIVFLKDNFPLPFKQFKLIMVESLKARLFSI